MPTNISFSPTYIYIHILVGKFYEKFDLKNFKLKYIIPHDLEIKCIRIHLCMYVIIRNHTHSHSHIILSIYEFKMFINILDNSI